MRPHIPHSGSYSKKSVWLQIQEQDSITLMLSDEIFYPSRFQSWFLERCSLLFQTACSLFGPLGVVIGTFLRLNLTLIYRFLQESCMIKELQRRPVQIQCRLRRWRPLIIGVNFRRRRVEFIPFIAKQDRNRSDRTSCFQVPATRFFWLCAKQIGSPPQPFLGSSGSSWKRPLPALPIAA